MPAATARAWGASGHGHTRTAGLVVVALVHVAMVAALVEGFRRHAAPTPPPLTQVKIDLEQPRPVPQTEPIPVPAPQLPLVQPRLVDIPEAPVVTPMVPATAPTVASNVPTVTGSTAEPTGSSGGESTAPHPLTREPVAPGMVCTAMGAPDMPAVNWNGEAVFRAVAEVHAGRVVSVDIRPLQGAMDVRTRRAFSNAIDTALKQRYVCPGDHRFQQDFSFRMD